MAAFSVIRKVESKAMRFNIGIILIGLGVLSGTGFAFAGTCENLGAFKLQDTTVISARTIEADALTPPPGTLAIMFTGMPAFCRIEIQIKPTKDSDIKAEVWLPSSGWNGKFLGRGNGGFGGTISYAELAQGIRSGYATAGTDTGHTGGVLDAEWAVGHPEKVIDFGYRAIHEMTVKAKILVKAFYGNDARYSYFGSCSNGSRASLMEAQRYPEDYIGILAGAPANDWTHNFAGFVWNAQALFANPGSQIAPSKLAAIHTAVLAACDSDDGIEDGVLNDPRTCRFDPAVLLCKAAESDGCLTRPQIEALKKIYAGPKNARGEVIFPGYFPGGELGPSGWAGWITPPAIDHGGQYLLGDRFFADMVFENPKWDYRSFNVDRDVKAADDKTAKILNSTNPNLKKFGAHGGKLVIYQGWDDAVIPPMNTIDYYTRVLASAGSNGEDIVRLYMVPGLQHCDGGSGASEFGQHNLNYDPATNIFSSLERWVETGVKPGSIEARQHKNPDDGASEVLMTRPICPYPQLSSYKGVGDTKNAANFVCK